jgi:hypothetical protein
MMKKRRGVQNDEIKESAVMQKGETNLDLVGGVDKC